MKNIQDKKSELKSIFDASLRNSISEEAFVEKVKAINRGYAVYVNFQNGVKDPSKQYIVMTHEFGDFSGTYLGRDLCAKILNH